MQTTKQVAMIDKYLICQANGYDEDSEARALNMARGFVEGKITFTSFPVLVFRMRGDRALILHSANISEIQIVDVFIDTNTIVHRAKKEDA